MNFACAEFCDKGVIRLGYKSLNNPKMSEL